MPDPHWKVLARRTIYDSPWVRLHQDDVRLPDGSVIEGHLLWYFARRNAPTSDVGQPRRDPLFPPSPSGRGSG